MRSQLRRGVLEPCVLALLSRDRCYGLDLARRLTDNGLLQGGEGTLYPLLSRLRKSGLVRTDWAESTSGPPRRYYSLTPEGGQALQTFRITWVTFRDAVDHTLDAEEAP